MVYIAKRRGPSVGPWDTPVRRQWDMDICLYRDPFKQRPVWLDLNGECTLSQMPISESKDSGMWWLTVSKAADRSSKIRTDD